MRSGIRKKLLLLIAALSLTLIAASVLISSRLYSDSLQRNAEGLCAETAGSLSADLEEQHIDFMQDYRDKITAVYREHRAVLESITVSTFKSRENREAFFAQLTEGIFPPRGMMGLSYDMLLFKSEYNQILNQMDMLSYASGLDVASVFYYDSKYGNMVYLIDRQPESSTLYNFPASVEKPENEQLKTALKACSSVTYSEDSACYALAPIGGTDGTLFVLFANLNTEIGRNVQTFSLYAFLITFAATAVISLVMLLFADKLIVANVKKLTAASEKFTSEIHVGHPEKVSAALRSGDEIGELSQTFDLMQDTILGYIGSLAEKTSAEERMKAELSLAARIQSEALPKGGQKKGAAVLESFLKPAREVGGDLYDYFMLDERLLFFCLADVSGKGIPASLFMMRAKELIKAGIRQDRALDRFAFNLNNELCAGNEESIFITAFFGILDTVSGALSFLRAGHEQPFLRRDSKVTRLGEESNFVLGIFDDAEFSADGITLEPGDVLLLYTDGLNEGINEEKEEFGYNRIADILRTAGAKPTADLYEALQAFCGSEEQFDDVTMLSIAFGKKTRISLSHPDYDDITSVTDTVLEELKGFEPDRIAEVGLMIDEIMNNEISYGFENTEEPEIDVILEAGAEDILLTFEDNGTAFDPLSEEAKEQSEASESGFGIMLVKNFSKEQHYERRDGKNRLTVRKRMTAPAAENAPSAQ